MRLAGFAAATALSLGTASCAPTGERSPPAPPADVVLDRRGVVVALGKDRLFDDDVTQSLEAVAMQRGRRTISLMAHRSTVHGRLVRVVDLAREARVHVDVSVYD